MCIGAGVLCNSTREGDYHHHEDKYPPDHALCPGHDYFHESDERHNGRTTLGFRLRQRLQNVAGKIQHHAVT